jgi:hypothetical protein
MYRLLFRGCLSRSAGILPANSRYYLPGRLPGNPQNTPAMRQYRSGPSFLAELTSPTADEYFEYPYGKKKL